MGFKLAVVLCLSFALVAKAQIGSAIANDLNAKENQLNCLLGKPSCVSPPPASPTPPGASPPATPPATPPTGTPPTPAPAPGPAAPLGSAVAVLSLSFPDGFVVTDDVKNRLVAIIQQELGSDAVVQLQVTGGRKLLQLTTVTLLITQVRDCGIVGIRLQAFIPGRFVSIAISIGIPLQAASLNTFACTYPGQPPYSLVNPPAVSPASAPGTPGSSPPGSPGSSPGGAPGTSPGTPGSSPGSAPHSGPVPAPSP